MVPVVAQWISAHLLAEEATQKQIPHRHWRGNDYDYKAARGAACAMRVGSYQQQERTRHLVLVQTAQQVIAGVMEASLEEAHAILGRPCRPTKRRFAAGTS